MRPLPRLTEPIVGFRYWFHARHTLYGAAGFFLWDQPEQTARHAWGSEHREPLEYCICGIHGFTRWRERDTLKWFDHWPSAEFNHQFGLIGGAIIAWGRVVEHGDWQGSEGFRAEHARILAVGDPITAKRYGVPYVPEKHLELYAGEFGQRFDQIDEQGR